MTMIDDLLDQFEQVMNEIKVLTGTVSDEDPRMKELLTFSNIIMGGIMVCEQAQSIDLEHTIRMQKIVRAYKGVE